MRIGALLRRAFPYLAIAVFGFALAYGIVFFFVLPPTGIPAQDVLARDSSVARAGAPESGAATPGTSTAPLTDSAVAPSPDTTLAASPPLSPPISLPDLSGMSLTDARTVLNALQLGVVTQRDTSSFQPENSVLRQTPTVGTMVERGSVVTIVLSYFPPPADSSAHSGSITKP